MVDVETAELPTDIHVPWITEISLTTSLFMGPLQTSPQHLAVYNGIWDFRKLSDLDLIGTNFRGFQFMFGNQAC